MNDLTELEQLNLKVAAIAGWTNIEQPDRNLPIKTFQGENKAHPELGKFVPKYAESIDAIVKVLNQFRIDWTVSADGDAFSLSEGKKGLDVEAFGETPAIALCKLLIELNPKPIAKAEVVEATFG